MIVEALADSAQTLYVYEFPDAGEGASPKRNKVPMIRKGQRIEVIALLFSSSEAGVVYVLKNPQALEGDFSSYFLPGGVSDFKLIDRATKSEWILQPCRSPAFWRGGSYDFYISPRIASDLVSVLESFDGDAPVDEVLAAQLAASFE